LALVGGVTARSATDLARVDRKTAAYSFIGPVRSSPGNWRIADQSRGLSGAAKVYFGGVRKGKRARGAAASSRLRHSQARRQSPHRDDPRCPQGRALPIVRQKVALGPCRPSIAHRRLIRHALIPAKRIGQLTARARTRFGKFVCGATRSRIRKTATGASQKKSRVRHRPEEPRLNSVWSFSVLIAGFQRSAPIIGATRFRPTAH
jgi:hypothetical protein